MTSSWSSPSSTSTWSPGEEVTTCSTMCCPTWARSASVSHGQFQQKVKLVLCSYLIGFASLTQSWGSWTPIYCVFFLSQVLVPSLLVPSESAVCHLRVQHPVRPDHPFLLLLQRSPLFTAAHEYLLVPGEGCTSRLAASVHLKFCDITSSLCALFPPCRVQFIVIFVVKVLKVKEVNDVREYEEEEDSKAAAGLLGESGAANKDDGAGHHIAAQGWAPPPPSVTFSFLIWQLSSEPPRSLYNPKITYQCKTASSQLGQEFTALLSQLSKYFYNTTRLL